MNSVLEALRLAGTESLAEFGIAPARSSYHVHTNESYNQFCDSNRLDKSLSVYIPRTLTAHINKENEYANANFLHEFFGHGAFCEYALPGKQIVSLEQELANLDSANKQTTNEYNDLKHELISYASSVQVLSEAIATWIEGRLCEQLGLYDQFEKKLSVPEHEAYRSLYVLAKDRERSFGPHALLYSAGFPKYYSNETLRVMLRDIYKQQYSSIQSGVIFGSKKPYSDIDLFLISDDIQNEYNDWIDVNARTIAEVERGVDLFDISITDPLLTGDEFIGNRINDFRERMHNAPITSDAIRHNRHEAERKWRIALTYPDDAPERKTGWRIRQTHLRVADELEKGNKKLTLTSLLS